MNKALLSLFIISFLIVGGNSFAQQIVRGFVVDSATQKPIEGAAVFFDKPLMAPLPIKTDFSF